MNFTDVRRLATPEGEVIKIACGTEILWCKQKYKKELLYLESTGTQYIDTALRLNQDSKVEMSVSHLDKSVTGSKIFGSRQSATANNFSVITGSVSGIMSVVVDFCKYSDNRLPSELISGETYEITISKEKLKINTSEKAVSTYTDFVTPNNAYLFNCSGTYPAAYNPSAMRLYYCRIYENEVLIRDFIPVLDWNDVPCLYDEVSDELFYNAGTDKFLYGEL
jgi:hypothetical protein